MLTPRPTPEVIIDRPALMVAAGLKVQRLAQWLAASAMVVGAAVLMGYLVHNERVVQLSPSLPPMYPNTAIALICGGVAVLTCIHNGAARLVGALAVITMTAVGAIGLWLNIARAGPSWYEGLFPDDFVAPTTPVGGRPATEACIAFVLLGVALGLMIAHRAPRTAQAVAFAAFAVGLTASVGFTLGVDRRELGTTFVYVGMALHTALAIAALGAAAVAIRPSVGITAQWLDGGLSGRVSRRLTAVVAGAPLVMGLAAAVLFRVLPTPELAQSVVSVIQVGVLSALVLVPATVILRTERQLRDQLLESRRWEESSTSVGNVVDALTGEMMLRHPEVPGWELGMRHEPAWGQLAGDSVQHLHRDHPEDATLVAVVDIAGHDAHSALLAYSLGTHISALWERGATLGELATSCNDKVRGHQTIATAVLLLFDHRAQTVSYVNAGHPPPLWLHGRHVTAWPRTGPLFGVPEATHEPVTAEVAVGDLLVLRTDGLDEARASSGELLGEQALIDVVLALHNEPPHVIADACVDAAVEHGSGRLLDDAMVVVLRRLRPVSGDA
ncbi:MAG: PP2C family protein-serine/threonine phosphatase [Acidimicrobiales bacterium]